MKRRAFVLLLVGAAMALGAGSWILARLDSREAHFYETGRSIQYFLGTYCQSLQSAAKPSGAQGLLSWYDSSRGVGSPGGARRDRRRWVAREISGSVRVLDLKASAASLLAPEDLLGDLAHDLIDFVEVDRAQCKIGLIEHIGDQGEITLTVRQTVEGRGSFGQLLQDRILLRWHLIPKPETSPAEAWRIAGDELVDGLRVIGTGAVLREQNLETLGIHYLHRRDPRLDKKSPERPLKFAVAEHASGGLSAADYDQDGRPDLFFADGVESRLYRNLGPDGAGQMRFVDITQDAGLGGIGNAHTAIFADFDNDGDRDLFVGGYLAPSHFFRNRGDGTFKDESVALGFESWIEPVTGSTLLDFDQDGFIDLYLGLGGHPFEAIPRVPFFARNGRANRLLRNLQGEGFADVTEEAGTGDTGWTLAVAAGDFDGDGAQDLAVANDFGRKSLYRNNSDGTFTEKAQEAGILDIGAGMGLAWGDMDGDGRADLYTSNIASNQRWFGEERTVAQYLRNVLRSRWFFSDFAEYRSLFGLVGSDWRSLGKQIGEGNSLFKNQGDGTFRELHGSRTQRAGWGWGVAFFDLENDGDLDLYAANGWISNTPETDL